MQDDKIEKRKKRLIVGSVLVLITILLITLGFLIYERIFSARLNIMVAPYTAKVKVGDMEFSASVNVARMHWAIENNLHGSLDVIFEEDRCRVKAGHAVYNLNIFKLLL